MSKKDKERGARLAQARAERRAQKEEEKDREAKKALMAQEVIKKANKRSEASGLLPTLYAGEMSKHQKALLVNLATKPVGQGVAFFVACSHINIVYRHFIRDLTTWKPNSHNPNRVLSSLARHLIAKYPVPSWMDVLFLQQDPDAHDIGLWAWVAHGKSIHTWFETSYKAGYPGPALTKKQAHLLLNTPRTMPLAHAIRRAQILSFGGSEALAKLVAYSRLMELAPAGTETYYEKIMQWLCVNEKLIPSTQIAPLVDYFYFKRIEFQAIPKWTMTGRSVNRVFADMNAWHADTLKSQGGPAEFAPSGFQPVTWSYLSADRGPVTLCVVELLTQKRLVTEGQKLRHCVSSYGGDVASGRTSIWSMRMATGEHTDPAVGFFTDPIVTIEVRNQAKAIVQARGFANRSLNAMEQRAVEHFAGQNGLAASYR
jgi:hypothetical protein